MSTPNKATSTLLQQVEQEAGSPLPVLLTRIGMKAMKDGDHQLAVNALSKAAAYVYPRLQAATPDTFEPVLYPPLVVENGMARIPDNWPGPTIRFSDRDEPARDGEHVIRFIHDDIKPSC